MDNVSTPPRQVPRLRLQTEPSNMGPQRLDLDDVFLKGTRLQGGGLLSPSLDPQSPLVKAISKSTSKDSEFRKVLGLLLSNLRNRKKPPSIYDAFRSTAERRDEGSVGVAISVLKAAVQVKKKGDVGEGIGSRDQGDSDDDYHDDQSYSTDSTVEHMSQLRDVLILSERMGLNVLSSTSTALREDHQTSPRTPFRRRGPTQARSRSSDGQKSKSNDLMDECVNLLSELIVEDCRFKVKKFRLSRPPNALQSICLDFAQCMLSARRQDAQLIVDVAFALLPAFTTFGSEMYPKLLKFFEDNIMHELLENLSIARGQTSKTSQPVRQSDYTSHATRAARQGGPFLSIRIDHPEEPDSQAPGWRQNNPPTANRQPFSLLSSSAPGQDASVYQLSAVISHLIYVVLDNVDWLSDTVPIDTAYRLHRLLGMIVDAKPDMYLDLLEIIAYQPDRLRRAAVAVLMSFWPEAVGHCFVGRGFPAVDGATRRLQRGEKVRRIVNEFAYVHEFHPWAFSGHRSAAHDDEGIPSPFRMYSDDVCHVCSTAISGFGLLCTLCMCAVHFECYDLPDGQFFIMYPSPYEQNTQKVAISRFSHVTSRYRAPRTNPIYELKHSFRLVNLFTLTLCLVCRMPLWGCAAQALECARCRQFAHPSCVASPTLTQCNGLNHTSSTFSIEWSAVRRTFVEEYGSILFGNQVSSHSFEEISVSYGTLWIQLQILRLGIASGSISIVEKRSSTVSLQESVVDDWDVQQIVQEYAQYLNANLLVKSDTLQEYQQMTRMHAVDDPSTISSILFDWPLLVYVTALLKSPSKQSRVNTQGIGNYLSVYGSDEGPALEESSHPFEAVLLEDARHVLAFEFRMQHQSSASYLLSHLDRIGFFTRLNPELVQDHGAPPHPEASIIFPLPLVIDYSTSVETLVSAIAVCLEDLDISVNEVGFLWLTRRCWPNGMASDYALHRLVGLIIGWIISEDDRLLHIARDFVARGLPLPGVRTTSEKQPWPARSAPKLPGGLGSGGSGAEYIACRKELLARYGAKWLSALHALDPELYTRALFEQALDFAADSEVVKGLESIQRVTDRDAAHADKEDVVLQILVKVCQTDAINSAFETLLSMWLDYALRENTGLKAPRLPSLQRLSTREMFIARDSMVLDPASNTAGITQDFWQFVVESAEIDQGGLTRSIRWLKLIAGSVVHMPLWLFTRLGAALDMIDVPFSTSSDFAEAMFCAAWYDPIGKHDLIAVAAAILSRHAEQMIQTSKGDGKDTSGLVIPQVLDQVKPLPISHVQFLRLILSSCVLLYGCDRRLIKRYEILREDYMTALIPARTRASSTASLPLQALGVDPGLFNVLCRFVTAGDVDICHLAAVALCILFTEKSLLATEAIGRYLSSNGASICDSSWRLWDLQCEPLYEIRARLFIKLLGLSSGYLESIVNSDARHETDWSLRFQAVDRLFKIILTFNDPGLIEDSTKASLVPILQTYFGSIWNDDREDVRLLARTTSRTLLPSHFATITSCFETAFTWGDSSERLAIAQYTLHLRPHFPQWAVLSWRCIVEALDESKDQGSGRPNPASDLLRTSLYLLSLQMIGSGIKIDLPTLIILKWRISIELGFMQAQLTQIEGTPYVRLGHADTPEGDHWLCMAALARALDSTLKLRIPASVMGGRDPSNSEHECYIGTVFVDIIIGLTLAVDLGGMPYIASRALLDSMVILIYKFDLLGPILSHLQEQLTTAIQRVTHLVIMDISYDIRSSALTVALAFLRRWPTLVAKILGRQIFSVSLLLTDLKLAKEDLLVAQGTAFLESAFIQFASNGLFILLLKFPIQEDFFDVVKHVLGVHNKTHPTAEGSPTLKEILISDTFKRLMERSDENLDQILPNFKAFVESVHHQGYSHDLMQDVISATNHLARLAADATAGPFRPTPWLEMCLLIIKHHRNGSRELMMAVEGLLKASIYRLEIGTQCLNGILFRSPTEHRNGEQTRDSGALSIVLDGLSDGLRRDARIPATTVAAMLQSVRDVLASKNYMGVSGFERLAKDCMTYLCAPLVTETSYVEAHFTTTVLAADVVHDMSKQDSNFIGQQFSIVDERAGKFQPSVKSWNALVLSALLRSDSPPASNLLRSVKGFVATYALSLALLSSGQSTPESQALDLNQAFTAIKLWMMLARRETPDAEKDPSLEVGHGVSSNELGATVQESIVWNELWPPFESLLVASAMGDTESELTSSTVAIWSSFADLVIFMHQIRSPIALEMTLKHSTILKELKRRPKTEAIANKFNRALKCLIEPPPSIPLESIIAQARTELLAGEKLSFALEKRRVVASSDRRPDRRRDNRTMT